MAKFTVTRLLETARYLQTDVGRQLSDFLTYMAEFVEQTVRALRSGLTFADNFDCQVKPVSVKHGVAQVISASKTIVGIIPIRVLSTTTGLDAFAWYYDDQGIPTIKASFTGAPAQPVEILLVLLF